MLQRPHLPNAQFWKDLNNKKKILNSFSTCSFTTTVFILNSVSKWKWQKSVKNLISKSSRNRFIFLTVFYLIMCFMKASKNFGKISILKIWELVSLRGAKTHFGKIALKQCIFRQEKKCFWLILCCSCWSNWDKDTSSTSKWQSEP